VTAVVEAALPDAADRFVANPALEAEMGSAATRTVSRCRWRLVSTRLATRHDPPPQLVEAVHRLDPIDPGRRTARTPNGSPDILGSGTAGK
jgi:hypothetical protein